MLNGTAELPEAHREVLGEVITELWMNVNASDVHTPADIAADVVQRLYAIYRVKPFDDGREEIS